MRQVVTTMIAVLSLAFASNAGAQDQELGTAAKIAEARRFVAAEDFASATSLLEELLFEAGASDKPTVIELLRVCYEPMAQQAEASGRARDAGYFRENLAIINRHHPLKAQAKPAEENSIPPTDVEQPVAKKRTPPAREHAGSRTLEPQASETAREPSAPPIPLEEPAQLPEPPRMPPPESLQKHPARPDPAALPAITSTRAPAPTAPELPSITSTRAPAPAAPESPYTNSTSAPAPAAPANDDDATPREPNPPTVRNTAVPVAPRPAPAGSSARPPRPPASQSSTSAPTLEEADRLFTAKRYAEAGQRYAALYRDQQLPPGRHDHWAYCRIVIVAQRINAGPASPRDWDEIEAEIQKIKRLAPNLWCVEYLRNKMSELRPDPRGRPVASDELSARGTAPEATEATPRPLPRLSLRSRGTPAAQPKPASTMSSPAPEARSNARRVQRELARQEAAAGAPSSPGAALAQQADASGSSATRPIKPLFDSEIKQARNQSVTESGPGWQTIETPNFRIFHTDARLAEQAGEAAESIRAAQARQWGTVALQKPWNPRCDLYLFPSGKALAKATSQPDTSPGFSSIESNRRRITSRRTALRADHPQLLTAVLPHEVTHVVLADVFIEQPIPRWADEGIAVLAEPEAEQIRRAADLQDSLDSGNVIQVGELMQNDNPAAKDWSLYYAQSVSLTRFLVEQGTPARFLQFIRDSHDKGIDAALRDCYRIEGLGELQNRWVGYAREQLDAIKEASRDQRNLPSATTVR